MKKILFSIILCLALAIPPELNAQLEPLESVVPLPSLVPSPTNTTSPLPTSSTIPSTTPSPTTSPIPPTSATPSPTTSPSSSVEPSLEPSSSIAPTIIATPQISPTPSPSNTATTSPNPSPAAATPQSQSSTPSHTQSLDVPAIGGALSEPSSSPTPVTTPNIIARRTTPTKIIDAGYYNFIEAPLAALQGHTYVKGYYTDQGLSPKTTAQLNLLSLILIVFGLYLHQTHRENFPITFHTFVKQLKHSFESTSTFFRVIHKRFWRSSIK